MAVEKYAFISVDKVTYTHVCLWYFFRRICCKQCIKVHIKGQKSSHGVALKLIIIYLKLYWLFSYKLFTLKHTIKQNLYYLKSRSKNQSYIERYL